MNKKMKTFYKISLTALVILNVVNTVMRNDPWSYIGYTLVGLISGLLILFVWRKAITIADL
jgi:F0F1-type ATP synthase assembly protein I